MKLSLPVAMLCLFWAIPAQSDVPTSADTFEILVTKDLVNMVKAGHAKFGKEAIDSMPLLEFRDIKLLRYDRTRGVEIALEFMPGVYDRLRPRLPRIAMRSFIIYQNHQPVYSGVLVPNDASFNYLKISRYCGPVIFLPPQNEDNATLNGFKISFLPTDEMYRRKDDPRGDPPMIWLFKKTGKIFF
jgi:hypothetical protein